MLQTQAVYPGTLGLLKKLVQKPELEGFVLAGGTALALQTGHRISVDLDFFTQENFDVEEVSQAITDQGNTKLLNKRKNSLNVIIDDVKVDVLRYPYPTLDNVIQSEGISMFSPKDIAAMKLDAMSARGAKKDFFDIFFLLRQFTISEMLAYHQQKYRHSTQFHIVRSLTYFDDAELEADPIVLENISWEQVKNKMRQTVKAF